jgi:hypothetical protein
MLQRGPRVKVRLPDDEARADAAIYGLVTQLLESRPGKEIAYKPRRDAEARRFDRARPRARDYMDKSIIDLAAECIGFRGRFRTGTQTAADILTRAFESTSDFPFIFENVLNKSLLARYELHEPTYRAIAEERPFKDFRPHPQIRVGEFPPPQPVSETGELKYGTASDTGTNVSVTPYGVILTISRQMLVNDDLGAIDQLLSSAGQIVSIFENSTFFAIFNSNPIYTGDGQAIFSSAHANLVQSGDGANPSISTYAAGRVALRNMTTPSGYFLNNEPAVVLTGPLSETAAEQLRTKIMPTLTTSANPFENLRYVTDPNIADTSWYMFVDPDVLPCFMFGLLQGEDGPRIRIHSPFGYQGIQISLEHDFGVGPLDFRGCFKNAGN